MKRKGGINEIVDHVDLVCGEFQQFFGFNEPKSIENLNSIQNVYFSGDIADFQPDSLTISVFHFLQMLHLAASTKDRSITSRFTKIVLNIAGYDRNDSNAKKKGKGKGRCCRNRWSVCSATYQPEYVVTAYLSLAILSPCLVDKDTAMILMPGPVITSCTRHISDPPFKDLRPAIAAAAIAVYQYNNPKRCNMAELDLLPLETMRIPGSRKYHRCLSKYGSPITSVLTFLRWTQKRLGKGGGKG